MPLWIDDYDAATSHLTAAEDGVYGRLLRLAWRTPGCSLPNDPAWIARKIRLSAEDFDAIAKPVLEEFFKVQRGRLIQKRLKAEYENISRKKSLRQNAGKKGGDTKALKNKGNDPSNASVLPGDMRAFPEPEPDPEVVEPSSSKAGVPEWKDRLAEAVVAAGDMADLTAIPMQHAADLRALVEPNSGAPCTWDEVLTAIGLLAARQRQRGKPIRAWSWVRDDALALRDKRLNAINPAPNVVPMTTPRSNSLTEQIGANNDEARRLAFERMDAQNG
nr:YdaU family protein [Phenylobacterium glaciei]